MNHTPTSEQSSVTYTVVVTRSALQAAPAQSAAVLSCKQLLTVKQAHTSAAPLKLTLTTAFSSFFFEPPI